MPRPQIANSGSKAPRFVLLASVCVVVAALYFAKDFLVPLALAILLSFLLTPLVDRLERWRVHRVLAVLIAVALAFGLIVGVGAVVVDQVVALANDLPSYRENIRSKLSWLRPGEPGVFTKIQKTVSDLKQEISHPTSQSTQPAEAATTQSVQVVVTPATTTSQPVAAIAPMKPGEPMPVTILPAPPTPTELLRENIALFASPLGTAAVVALLAIFILLSREDLRNRLIRLIGYGSLTVTTQAMNDATNRISRYLSALAMVNGSYGVTIALGLWLIGMTVGHSEPPFPNVVLWGLLCAVLRFIPYVGPWLGASLPILLSLAVYKGTGVFVSTVGLFVAVELITNNVLEPKLYGSSTGMSPIAVVISAIFWTWLWGPVGLVLSMPLTVCLVVLGKHVPAFSFLATLLGDEEVLSPAERLYQRWLALDQEEAADLAHELFETRSLEEMYDAVLLPVLGMAEDDRHRGQLDDARQSAIRQGMRALVDEIGDDFRERTGASGARTSDVPGKKSEPKSGRVPLRKDCILNVLVLPAHHEADEIAGLMLGQLLEFNNYRVTTTSQQTLAGEMVEMAEKQDIHVVCVSALPPAAVTHARYLCKRLHQRNAQAKVVVGLWTLRGELDRAKKRIGAMDCMDLVTKLSEALNRVEQITHDVVAQQRDGVDRDREPSASGAAK